ncbi:MAG: DUF1592 domain-containing protein [Myxococcota bacterium]
MLLSALALSGATGLGTGCVGEIGGVDVAPPDAEALGVAELGLRRLTTHELDNLVADVFGDTTRPASRLLPEDFRTPFDNAYAGQQISQVLIAGAEAMAIEVAGRFVAEPGSRLGCVPKGPNDVDCLTSFVRTRGQLAWRRALTEDEVSGLVALGRDFAMQSGDFMVGVDVVVRAFVQSPSFLYRLEIGTELGPNLYGLTPAEVASRMAFLVWGSGPDTSLLERAEAGELDRPEGRRAVLLGMLDDPRARRQLERFHAMWLGYEQLPHAPDLSTRMRQESAALVERVVFEDRSWLDLFTSTETFADDTLLAHYGLAPAGASEPRWVDVRGSGREGLLGHGSFLSAAANPGDTSPTKRGVLIRERLMCNPVPPPPPDVPVDQPQFAMAPVRVSAVLLL